VMVADTAPQAKLAAIERLGAPSSWPRRRMLAHGRAHASDR
jgi:hypothetical protein